MRLLPIVAFAVLSLSPFARAADAPPAAPDADGFAPLFNGRDLAGWVPVNVAPSTFAVRDGQIVTTGKPTGVMRTDRQYENFVLELDWMHVTPGGNSGVFVWSDALTAPGVPFTRAFENQVLDEAYFTPEAKRRGYATGQGDVFAIHGSSFTPDRPHPGGWMRCLPSENRTHPAGQWNHYQIECNDGTIKLAVNGKVVSGGTAAKPRKGYVCLEAEGAECHFKNIRLKELRSTNPKPEEIATADEGFHSIFTGLDLFGWLPAAGQTEHWRPNDWMLDCAGKSDAKDKTLWTTKPYRDFTLIADWRLAAKPKKVARPVILPSGELAKDQDGKPREQEVADAGEAGIVLRGSEKARLNLWCWPIGSGDVPGYRTDAAQPADVRAAATPKARADNAPGKWNRFIITMKGERLTVVLNGKPVIENAALPGVATEGRIGLEDGGSPVQFGNLYVKELAN